MSKFILGPSIDNVVEVAQSPTLDTTPRTGVTFGFPPIIPGGSVKLIFHDGPAEFVKPINVYAFYIPSDQLPTDVTLRTPDWFFLAGHKSGVTSTVGLADNAEFVVSVAGVLPSLTPYLVQTILEYPA
jgi:hypothetical protein